MSKKPKSPDTLRDEAEAMARTPPTLVNPQPGEELLHNLLHNLQVHQIELKMQNDELRQLQIALEESRDRYVDLYDFAPIGYLTLSREGTISEINLTGADMLGVQRNKLIHRRFSQFVASTDQDRWYLHFASVIKHEQRQRCELLFQRGDDTHFHAQLDSQLMKSDGSVRIALTDITEHIQHENAGRDAQKLAGRIVDTLPEALVVLDGELKIVSANRAFYEFFHTSSDNTVGRPLEDLGNRQWDNPELKALLETILPLDHSFDGFEVEHDFPTIGKRKVRLNARRISDNTGESPLILMAIEIV